MATVELRDLYVEFAIYNARARAVKTEIFRRALGNRRVGADVDTNPDSGITVVKALNGINLSVASGERVGLIGHNGAGKTTLLRVLGRIYPPTSGMATISGSISSLIDISMGLDGEATGYENIVMKATLLGMSRDQIEAIIPDVEEFSELGAYLNLPIRTYSSGMQLRLAFAISTAAPADIVILDEIIGVGDASFASKSQARLEKLIDGAHMLFLSTHDMQVMRANCSRAIWIKEGRILLDGPSDAVIEAYLSDAEANA